MTFANGKCSNKAGDEFGTCYTKSECDSYEGKAIGTCAKGFGVCCKGKLKKYRVYKKSNLKGAGFLLIK